MAKGKRAVIVGIPGVGKSTVVNRAVEILEKNGLKVENIVFGTMMFEEAVKAGVATRDQMRSLPVEKQRTLQIKAASVISKKQRDNIVLVDTHLFIRTPEGYWPGLPFDVLKALSPTHLILVLADPQEILNRRVKDETRKRDIISLEDVQNEIEIARRMLSAASLVSGAAMMEVQNHDGKVEEAAQSLAKVLGASP